MVTSSSSSLEAICQNEFDQYGLVDPPRILERGFMGLGGDLIVDEGTVIVLTEDGKFVRTLPPGKYALRSFQHGSQLKAYTVYTALNTFLFKANNHFRIFEKSAQGKKVGFPVNVSMAVKFFVNPDKAHILIARGHKPVNILCMHMTSIIWNKLSQIGYDAFCGSGSFLAQEIHRQLLRDGIEGETGLTVKDVLPQAFDGADEIGQKVKESVLQFYDVLREFGLSERDIWVVRNPNSLLAGQAAALYDLRKMIIEKMLEKGYAPSFIEQFVDGGDISKLINIVIGNAPPVEKIPEQPVVEVKPPSITPQTIDQEWDALEKLVGVGNLSGRPTTSGIRDSPDGGYLFDARFNDTKGNSVTVTLHLPPGYANGAAPSRTVKRNGVAEDYPAVEPGEWRRNPKLTSLVEVVQRTYS